ncbi:MAG: hypothetical protein WKF34_04305 [Pyrinomonadaceae bacterium]
MARSYNANIMGSVLALLLLSLTGDLAAQKSDEHAIAARFAPVFIQALGDDERSDYVTNFDFDGDWRGDNNWENAGNAEFPLRAFIYYAVSETETHHFLHYAVFHPRDYKGGVQQGRFLSELMRQGAKIVGGRDPTGLLKHASAAHENDMEGALVVVEKNETAADARVVFVETLAHNTFSRYASGHFGVEGEKPKLYIEPRGHGIEGDIRDSERSGQEKFLIYRFSGQAENPETTGSQSIGYELLPLKSTLWPKAVGLTRKKNATYGSTHDYADVSIKVLSAKGASTIRKVKLGGLGSAFLGTAGSESMARPPWGWFDSKRQGDPLGLWFFDPATIIKRDFDLGESFSTTYIRVPFWAGKPVK